MKKLIVATLMLTGCLSSPPKIHQVVEEDTEWGFKRTETTVKAPNYPVGESYLISSNGTLRAVMSGSQDAQGIEEAKAEGRGMMVMYGACGIVLLLGVVAFALPNYIVSNKDALIICGIGGASFAVVRWVSASSAVMMWVVPVVVVLTAVYLGFLWWRKRIP